MAITVGALLEVSIGGEANNNAVFNVWQYEVTTSFPAITAENVAEAWWQHVKAVYRGIAATNYSGLFRQVMVRELNAPTGAFGSWAIPSAEWAGTRSPGSAAEFLPTFNAAGVRLNVGTRVTRPGQKRFCGLVESDNNSGSLTAGVLTAIDNAMVVMIASMTLGAPAATMVLRPVVTRKDATGVVTAHQPIGSYSTNNLVTSQVSRKPGRGI